VRGQKERIVLLQRRHDECIINYHQDVAAVLTMVLLAAAKNSHSLTAALLSQHHKTQLFQQQMTAHMSLAHSMRDASIVTAHCHTCWTLSLLLAVSYNATSSWTSV
jgi:hypothetical protein